MARARKRGKRRKKPPEKPRAAKPAKSRKRWYPGKQLDRERELSLQIAEKWIAVQGGDRSLADPGLTYDSAAYVASALYGRLPTLAELRDYFRRTGATEEYLPTEASYPYEINNLVLEAHRRARWASFGMPVYVLDPETATMLALTDVDTLAVEDLKLPFPTFLIVLEPGAPLHISVDGRLKEVRMIWVHRHDDARGDPMLTLIATTATGYSIIVPYAMGARTVAQWLGAGARQVYGPTLTPTDAATAERVIQLVVSLTMYLAQHRPSRQKPRHELPTERIEESGLPLPSDWVVRPIAMPAAIAEALREQGPTTSRTLAIRHVVRGHWRMQPYGPGRALRRPQWIAPHWRGHGPEALTRTMKVPPDHNPAKPRTADEIRSLHERRLEQAQKLAQHRGIPLHVGMDARRELFRRFGLPSSPPLEDFEWLGYEDPLLAALGGRGPSAYYDEQGRLVAYWTAEPDETTAQWERKQRGNPAPSAELVAERLAKLTVGKGGKGSSAKLPEGFAVRFHENVDRATRDAQPYVIALEYQGRTQRAGLRWEDVYSKSKGTWARDKVWRLTPEALTKWSTNIARAIEQTLAAAPNPEHDERKHGLLAW